MKSRVQSMNNGKYALYALPAVVALLGISVFATSLQSPMTSIPVLDDGTEVTGHVILKVYDTETGKLKNQIENHNLVVDVGLDEMAEAVFGAGGVGTTNFDYIHIGTGVTAPTAGDTTIETSACARVQDASPDASSVISGETSVSVISSFDGGTCAGAITEAGIFNSLAGGQMLARSTFGAVTIGSGDTLNVNYTITIT